MKEKTQNQVALRLYNWFMRKTIASAVRRIGELPIALGSDIGNVRKENQDRVAVLKMNLDRNKTAVIVALCDGMGGMVDGSICAAQALSSFLDACLRQQNGSPATRLLKAAQEANQAVFTRHQGRGGATLSAVMYDESGGMTGVNVGDSRIYAYRERILDRLTIDDTMAGVLHKEDEDLPNSNELLQFIGIGKDIEPHIIEMPATGGWTVLTSDGVHYIEKIVMALVIQHAQDPAVAVRRLVEVAKWCGGRDNASIAIVAPFTIQPQLFDDPASIQVWDPYGELQMFVENRAADEGATKPEAKSRVPYSCPVEQPKKRNAKQPKKIKVNKNEKNKNETKIENGESPKELVQMKIYFDNEGEGDGHN